MPHPSVSRVRVLPCPTPPIFLVFIRSAKARGICFSLVRVRHPSLVRVGSRRRPSLVFRSAGLKRGPRRAPPGRKCHARKKDRVPGCEPGILAFSGQDRRISPLPPCFLALSSRARLLREGSAFRLFWGAPPSLVRVGSCSAGLLSPASLLFACSGFQACGFYRVPTHAHFSFSSRAPNGAPGARRTCARWGGKREGSAFRLFWDAPPLVGTGRFM